MTVHIAELDDGRTEIIGVDFRSFTEHTHPDGTKHKEALPGGPKVFDYAEAKRLVQIREIHERAMRRLAEIANARAMPGVRMDEAFTAETIELRRQARGSMTPSDKIRETAELHMEALAIGERKTSLYVQEKLRERGEDVDVTVIRNRVSRARKQGLVP